MTLYISAIDISGHKRHILKTAVVYLAVSVFCIIFDQIYALFGHGIHSVSMSFMFLYPLIGGVLIFSLHLFIFPAVSGGYYRFFYNLYNSGIAALSVKSLLNGVFEIAGTSSPYLIILAVCGWTMVITSILILFIHIILNKKLSRNQ